MSLVLGGLAFFISMVALWLAADVQRSTTKKNTLLLQSQVNPLRDAVKSDRIENEKLRKQVTKDRDIIESLDQKVKFLEDKLILIEGDLKTIKQSPPATGQASATGTNG
jgi:predicted nuclease with TOPRIM domain